MCIKKNKVGVCWLGVFFFNNLFTACSITLLCNTTCLFYPLHLCCSTTFIHLLVTVPFITYQSLLSLWNEQSTLCIYSLVHFSPSASSEINPTRCNNCVYSSQWLYSTCFGWQFHPSSGVHMLYMASGRQVYLCCNFVSIMVVLSL